MGLLGSCQGSLPFSVKLWHQRRAKVSFQGRTREQKLEVSDRGRRCSGPVWPCSSQEPEGGLRPVGKGRACRTLTSGAVSTHLPSQGLATSKPVEARTADGRSLLPREGRGQGSPGRTWAPAQQRTVGTAPSRPHGHHPSLGGWGLAHGNRPPGGSTPADTPPLTAPARPRRRHWSDECNGPFPSRGALADAGDCKVLSAQG